MRTEVRLQQLSMGMSEAEIVQWCVGEGDRVESGSDLVEIEAEKVTVMVPAPATGIVREVGPGPGAIVEIRGLLCVIEADA